MFVGSLKQSLCAQIDFLWSACEEREGENGTSLFNHHTDDVDYQRLEIGSQGQFSPWFPPGSHANLFLVTIKAFTGQISNLSNLIECYLCSSSSYSKLSQFFSQRSAADLHRTETSSLCVRRSISAFDCHCSHPKCPDRCFSHFSIFQRSTWTLFHLRSRNQSEIRWIASVSSSLQYVRS